MHKLFLLIMLSALVLSGCVRDAEARHKAPEPLVTVVSPQ